MIKCKYICEEFFMSNFCYRFHVILSRNPKISCVLCRYKLILKGNVLDCMFIFYKRIKSWFIQKPFLFFPLLPSTPAHWLPEFCLFHRLSSSLVYNWAALQNSLSVLFICLLTVQDFTHFDDNFSGSFCWIILKSPLPALTSVQHSSPKCSLPRLPHTAVSFPGFMQRNIKSN